MSTIYTINTEGIIVEQHVGFFTHYTPKGKMVKPRDSREEKILLEYSRNQQKIKALLEERKALEEQKKREFTRVETYTREVEDIFLRLQKQEHDLYIPGRLLPLLEQWRQASSRLDGDAYIAEAARVRREGLALMECLQQAKLEHLTGRAAVLGRIDSLRKELWTLSGLEFQAETEDGPESWEAEVDLRTKGALTAMEKELNEISDRIATADPAGVQEDNALLEAMEEKLMDLPALAKQVYARQVVREEEMERIAQRLEDSGWELLELLRGESIHDECSLFIQSGRGEKASIRFSLEGTVEIVSQFQENSFRTRERLQQLVLETIRDGGEKAKGTCMDHQPPAAAWARETVPEEESFVPHQRQPSVRQITTEKQEGKREMG